MCVRRDVPRDSAAVLFTHACYSSTHLFSGSDAGLWWNPRSVIRYWDASTPWSLLEKSSAILGPSTEVWNLLLIDKDSSWEHLLSTVCTVCVACTLSLFWCCLVGKWCRSVELTHPHTKKKKKKKKVFLYYWSVSLSWWEIFPKLALFISPLVLFYLLILSVLVWVDAVWGNLFSLM